MPRKPDKHATLDLHDLAILIKTVWDTAHGHHGLAIHDYLRIGHALLTARRHFKADRDYGEWFHGQGFVFGTEWARQMRLAAEHEAAVRTLWQEELEAGREPSLKRCLAALRTELALKETEPVATQVATIRYPESERQAWLAEQLAPSIGRGQPAIRIVNDIEDALRAWEDDHEDPLLDLLGPHLDTDLDTDERVDLVTETLAVLRGE